MEKPPGYVDPNYPPAQPAPPPGYAGPPPGQPMAPPAGQAYPPPGGYQPQYGQPQYGAPQGGYAQGTAPMQPGYGQPVVVGQPMQSTTVVVAGNGRSGCRNCQNGFMVEDYSVVGIILAVLCFPWGILCCMMMKERKCANCGFRN